MPVVSQPATMLTTPRVWAGSTLLDALHWFFVFVPETLLRATGNYLVANIAYFAIPLHARTLFAYWHRDFEVYEGGVHVGGYFRVVVINTVSRIIGALIRSVTILMGFVVEVVIALLGAATLVVWFAAPLVLVGAYTHVPHPISFPTLSFAWLDTIIRTVHALPNLFHGVL